MAEAQRPNNDLNRELSAHRSDRPRGYRICTIIDAASVALYLCGFCEFVLRLPCQVECGHQFCEECLRHRLQVSSPIECPLCMAESETTHITHDNYQPDFASRRKMQKMGVYCENNDAGCPWQDKLKQLDAHLADCEYSLVECPDCKQMVTRGGLQDHLQNDCLGASLNTSGPCMFGCQGLQPDVDIEQHNLEFCATHVEVIWKEVDKLRRMQNRINKLSEKLSSLSNTREVEREEERAGAANTAVNECMDNLKKMDVSTKTSTNLINVAFKEVQRVAARLVDLEKLFQEQFIGSSSGELSERQQEISRLSEQLSRQNMSHDGVLLWEITGVRQLIEEATRDGAHINSPVFSTSQIGHRLMARIYLNGDGTGKDHFISLFIVVCKGPFDGTITWPLKELVRFTLFDQSGNREHHQYTFCTDPSSTSFARPRQPVNIASGCPKFLSLPEFNRRFDHFVQEDTMMLEIRIDRGLPTA